MSDEEIRKILIERKRKAARREELRDCLDGFVGFGSILFIGFMLSVMLG